MSQEYRRLNGSTPMQVYTKIAFIGILVCIAYAVLSKGEFYPLPHVDGGNRRHLPGPV